MNSRNTITAASPCLTTLGLIARVLTQYYRIDGPMPAFHAMAWPLHFSLSRRQKTQRRLSAGRAGLAMKGTTHRHRSSNRTPVSRRSRASKETTMLRPLPPSKPRTCNSRSNRHLPKHKPRETPALPKTRSSTGRRGRKSPPLVLCPASTPASPCEETLSTCTAGCSRWVSLCRGGGGRGGFSSRGGGGACVRLCARLAFRHCEARVQSGVREAWWCW